MVTQTLSPQKMRSPLAFLGLVTFIAIAAVLTACSSSEIPTPTPEHVKPVDIRFRDLHKKLGERRIGPAISDPIIEEDRVSQYFETVKMVFDLRAPYGKRIFLAPLGSQLGVEEPAVPKPTDPNAVYIQGHLVYSDSQQLFFELGGEDVVGRPLTEARLNSEANRIEQYFENMGFYRLLSEPAGSVHLLAYGATACDFRCRYEVNRSAAISEQSGLLLPEPFLSTHLHLGESFTGRQLTSPFFTKDGKSIVVFENLVLFTSLDNPGKVSALPIVELIGIHAQPPVDRLDDPRMTFFLIEGNKGFNIPVVFNEYLAAHGGLTLSGYPITELFEWGTGVYRQCFQNLCLDYYAHAQGNLKIRLAPLGKVYWKDYFSSSQENTPGTPSLNKGDVTIQVAKRAAFVNPYQAQTVVITVKAGQSPLQNARLRLTFTLPNGEKQTLSFPETSFSGQTSLEVPPIQARNGTIIPFSVCLEGFEIQPLCVDDSYMIWE